MLPVNKEPDKGLALTWFTVHELPDDIIEYPDAGLLGYLDGTGPLTVHNWKQRSRGNVGNGTAADVSACFSSVSSSAGDR